MIDERAIESTDPAPADPAEVVILSRTAEVIAFLEKRKTMTQAAVTAPSTTKPTPQQSIRVVITVPPVAILALLQGARS